MEGDREYRALRRQWAEEKRKKTHQLDSPRSARDDLATLNVRNMLDTKEVTLPEPSSSSSSTTATTTADAATSTG